MAKIRLILVDDQVLFRESLGSLLALESDFELAGQFDNAAAAFESPQLRTADILIASADAARPLIDGIRAAGAGAKVIEIADTVEADETILAMRAGASGVIAQNSPPDSLALAVRAVAGGGVWFEQVVVQRLAEAWLAPGQSSRLYFTNREEQVLEGICEGLTNRKIATRAGLTEAAVKATVRQLLRRAGVKTRSQLVGSVLLRREQFAATAPPPASPGQSLARNRRESG